jgi:hypothetical protein
LRWRQRRGRDKGAAECARDGKEEEDEGREEDEVGKLKEVGRGHGESRVGDSMYKSMGKREVRLRRGEAVLASTITSSLSLSIERRMSALPPGWSQEWYVDTSFLTVPSQAVDTGEKTKER